MNDRKRTASAPGAPQDAPEASEHHVVLTPPTSDEEDYLNKIQRSSADYDPNVIIGGPRLPSF